METSTLWDEFNQAEKNLKASLMQKIDALQNLYGVGEPWGILSKHLYLEQALEDMGAKYEYEVKFYNRNDDIVHDGISRIEGVTVFGVEGCQRSLYNFDVYDLQKIIDAIEFVFEQED